MNYEFTDGTLTVPLVENAAPIPLEAHEVRFSTTIGGTTNSKVVRIPYSQYDSITAGSELRRYLFRLTLEDNRALGLSRTIGVEVRAIAADGGEGDWFVAPDAFNPPPAKPQLGIVPGVDAAVINIIPEAGETDRRSWIVVVSDDPDANPDLETPFLSDHQGNTFTVPLDGTARYVWVAGVDVMGLTQLDWSLPVALTRRSMDDIIDPIISDIEDLRDGFVVDASALVANQLLNVGATLLSHENAIQQSLYTDGVPVNEIGTTVLARIDEVETSQQQVTTQLSAQAGNIAAATTQVTTLATEVEAQTQTVTTLVASVDGRISAVETQADVFAGELAAEATTRNSQISALGDAVSSQIESVTTSVTAERARIDSHSQQLVSLGNSLAVVGNQTTANTTAISTETTNRTTQLNTLGNDLAAFKTTTNTKVDGLLSTTGTHTQQISSHGGSLSAINTTLGTLATNIAAETTARQTLAATVNNNRTAFDQQVTLQANNHSAQGTAITNLGTRVGTTETNIGLINTTLNNGSLATASSVSTLSARLNSGGDIFSSITNATSVAVDAQGRANAIWGLESNVNGLISGIRLGNDGLISRLDFMASRIRFINDAGTSAIVPFEIAGNKVRLKDTEIDGNLLVSGTVNNVHIEANTITSLNTAYQSALTNLTGNVLFRAQGVWINVEKATSPIDIRFNALINLVHNAGGSFTAFVQLWRSRSLATGSGTVISAVTLYGSGMANDTFQGFIPLMATDRPGETGEWHYYVTVATNTANMSTQTIAARYMSLMEFKTNTDGSLGMGTGSAGGGGTPPPDTGGGGGTSPYDPTNPGGGGGGGVDEPTLPQA